jgi:hypothetical protein
LIANEVVDDAKKQKNELISLLVDFENTYAWLYWMELYMDVVMDKIKFLLNGGVRYDNVLV